MCRYPRPIPKMLTSSPPLSSDASATSGGTFLRRRIDWLAERQEEPHHQIDALLQGLAQLAVGCRQAHFFVSSAIESLSAFCTLTEGLTSTLVSGQLGDTGE